jgi:hypothetical protein
MIWAMDERLGRCLRKQKTNMNMKTNIPILTVAVALCLGWLNLNAAEKHDHKHLLTPKGGRLLEKTEPHAEFFVEKDRTVTIHFYSEDLKPVAVANQTATIIADTKDGKEKIDFEKKGDSLVSKRKLPEGEGYNVVVQFKQNAEARPQNFRFKLDLHTCGECKRAEYACSCDH